MKFQEFTQLFQSASSHSDFNEFKAANQASSKTPVCNNQLTFIWEFSREPVFSTIRRLSKLSQAAFAASYPPPQRSIENWDTGMRTPPNHVLMLLAFAVCSDIC